MTRDLNAEIERELRDLRAGLNELGLSYDDPIPEKFRIFLEVLFRARKRLHLLSKKDYTRIAKRHLLASLLALEHIDPCGRVCDIGTGPGFPSIPIKIFKPRIKLTLIEARSKKAEFLAHLVKKLDYPDINIINQRAEDYHGQQFEIILLRAVGRIKDLLEPIGRLLEPAGKAVFYKTQQAEKEIDTHIRADYHIAIEKLFTPLEHAPLALVILQQKKVRNCP
jgi:16S rRNA (guanine527-N7)-methyltransferase